MSSYDIYTVYYQKSDLNVFENVSTANEESNKSPFGYSFNDHVWAYIYNQDTFNKVGYIIVNTYYVNVNTEGGYVTDDAVVFLESDEFPIGSINYLYNFYTPTNDSLIPSGNENYPTVRALTGDYYGKNILLNLDISPSETRTLTIYVKK